ncbi:type I restriction endonuclease subunit R [Photobacterium leiognathi]|uniref:type I restriction endonuclease subunit R n=1 Tax=Photobacterium leiognathi TaxID=553611 RepID=UPI003F75144E
MATENQTQSEAQLEIDFIKQLNVLGFDNVTVGDADALKRNLKTQLELANNLTLTEREFESVLISLEKGSLFDKSKRLRGKVDVTHEDGSVSYLTLLFDEPSQNRFQVTSQVNIQGKYENRYDVTLLVNGLPLVQIELKRRGIEMAEAFNQIRRYDKHTYGAEGGLFNYVQLFVISNGVNTKYFSNNRELSFKQTFYWTDESNNKINALPAFTESFLNKAHLTKMLNRYIVQNETGKFLMVLRPYQFYAVEAIVNKVERTDKATGVDSNGYIWHTTGSGKTLTSFKAAQLLTQLDNVDRVLFVVDRKDLDYQTAKEFNAFLKGCVDSTDKTKSLLNQFLDKAEKGKKVNENRNSKLIVTTLQKLNNLVTKAHYKKQVESLKDQRIVFIFDECHRSQFGDTHHNIIDFFTNAQLFGFTGTPILADNATAKKTQNQGMQKKTTKDLFGERLHSYVIVDAIRDDNVLPFAIEYYGKLKHKKSGLDADVSSIDITEFFSSPKRIKQVCEHIIGIHGFKTKHQFNAMLCVASVPDLITYYDTLKRVKRGR